MKTINKTFRIFLLLLGLLFFVKFSLENNISKALSCLCIPVLLVIPKILRKNINNNLEFIYYIYIFLLLIFGCLFNFYSIFKHYDLFAHFIFGFATSIIAIYLLNIFNIQNKNIVFNIIFIVACTLSLASFWEIFEYISSIIFNDDIQNVLTTGVRDTMEDIIASFFASIIFIIFYMLRKDKVNILVKPRCKV